MKSNEEADVLAKKITKFIFDCEHRPDAPGTRIAVKSGEYPDNETDQGGFCRNAFQEYVKEIIEGKL